MKAGVIYWHGGSYGDSWSSHGFNSFSQNKKSLQCPKRTAFTAWNFFFIWLNWWSRTSKIAVFFSFAEEWFSEGICAVNVTNQWAAWCYYLNSVLHKMKFSSYFTEQQQKVSFNQCTLSKMYPHTLWFCHGLSITQTIEVQSVLWLCVYKYNQPCAY